MTIVLPPTVHGALIVYAPVEPAVPLVCATSVVKPVIPVPVMVAPRVSMPGAVMEATVSVVQEPDVEATKTAEPVPAGQ